LSSSSPKPLSIVTCYQRGLSLVDRSTKIFDGIANLRRDSFSSPGNRRTAQEAPPDLGFRSLSGRQNIAAARQKLS